MFQAIGGEILAVTGAIIAFLVAGFGSTKGVGMAGHAGVGVLTEKPDLFGSVMVLEAIPTTQAIYGFVVAFMIMGKIGGEPLGVQNGFLLLFASLPIAIIGVFSALYQARIAVSGIHMLVKQPDSMGKTITLALMAEMFAIIALIISILMIGKV